MKIQEALTYNTTPTKVEVKNSEQNDDEMFVQKLTTYSYNLNPAYFFQTARLSIFDEVPWFQNVKTSNERKIYSPEMCLYNVLEKMDIKDTAFAMNVKLVDIIYDEKPVSEYTELGKGAEFDFVIIDKKTDAVLLVIEVDGEHHRYNFDETELKKIQDNDKKKEELVKELNGHIVESIVGPKSFIPSNASFIFLRLPSDGTMYWETDAVYKNAYKHDRKTMNNRTTIDELIKLQHELNECEKLFFCSSDYELYEMIAKSLTKTIYSFNEPNAIESTLWDNNQFCKKMNSRGVNKVLENLGYLEKDGNNRIPTKKGFACGIETRIFNDKEKGECLYPIYSLKARRILSADSEFISNVLL